MEIQQLMLISLSVFNSNSSSVQLSVQFCLNFVSIVKKMAKTKSESSSKGKADGNPPKNLRKVTKAKNRDVTARMIIEALNRMDADLKEGEAGHSLAKLRGNIKKYHGLEMPKYRQELIKEIMKSEFEHGRIEMTNNDGSLNFKMRFQATINDDDIEDENTASSATEEEE